MSHQAPATADAVLAGCFSTLSIHVASLPSILCLCLELTSLDVFSPLSTGLVDTVSPLSIRTLKVPSAKPVTFVYTVASLSCPKGVPFKSSFSLVSRRSWLEAALHLLAQSFLPLLLREQPGFSSVSLTEFLGNNFLCGGGLLHEHPSLHLLHEHPSLHLRDVILLL